MATTIQMVHPSGLTKTGIYGFSWTTLFFSGIPAILRGDLLTGILLLLSTGPTLWIAPIIWAFVYNKTYTTQLIEQGYVFNDTPDRVEEAKKVLKLI